MVFQDRPTFRIPPDAYKRRRYTKDCLQNLVGHYEFIVMPFGHWIAPTTFMDLMNRVYIPMLDRSLIMFIGKILVFLKTQEQHNEHMREVLEVLRKEKLYENFSKCQFWLREV